MQVNLYEDFNFVFYFEISLHWKNLIISLKSHHQQCKTYLKISIRKVLALEGFDYFFSKPSLIVLHLSEAFNFFFFLITLCIGRIAVQVAVVKVTIRIGFVRAVKPVFTKTSEQQPPLNNGCFDLSTTSLSLTFTRPLFQTDTFFRSHG